MRIFRKRASFVWLILIAGLLIGCSPSSTPPGASSIGGTVDGVSYSYHYWEDGLAFLIWHDLWPGAEGCTGTGSTEDTEYRLACTVEAQDGRRFEFEAHTSDGVTAEMWLDGDRYDLSQGAMFLVSAQDGGLQVEQLYRDLSELEPGNEAISAIPEDDTDVARFIALASDSPGSDTDGGLTDPIAQGEGGILSPPDESTDEPAGRDEDLLVILPEALANHDLAALEEMMGDSFIVGYWLSEGQILTPAEAMEQLRTNWLPNPAGATFTADPGSLPDLGEFDPRTAFGPDVEIVDLVYSQGWGSDGQDGAILLIGMRADGSPYWHGMIYGIAGFSETGDQPPQSPALSYEAAPYQNRENGFELDYPSSWSVKEQVLGVRASGAQFLSEDEIVMSAVVYLWDPKNDLDAYVGQRQQAWSASGNSILSEAELTLAGGRRAVQFIVENMDKSTTFMMLTNVGERYLEVSGTGDLNLLAEIAQTVRPLATPPDGPATELVPFESQLMATVSSRDQTQMQALMDETFGFAFWGSEGYELSSQEAVVNIQNYLAADQTIDFEVDPPDLEDILGPLSILSVWDPARNPVDALFSTGWGADGQDEAFLIIIQKPDGSFAWDGIVLASGSYGGFIGLYSPSS